jgi:type IV pilus assembly protein PilC
MPKEKKQRGPSFLDRIGTANAREYFIENLSVLAGSGMGISDALTTIANDVGSKRVREVILRISEEIDAGTPLWRSLARERIFPDTAVSLIRIGEESGRLSENLRVVSLTQEKDRVFRSKIRSAMVYPVFVLSLTLVVGISIAWFILPRLSTVFSQLHIPLPAITKIVIGIGAFLGMYGRIAVPVAVLLLMVVMYFLFFFPKTKVVGQSMLFMLPGVDRLIRETELSRFGYLLGTLLQAGLPIVQALESLSQASFFPHYKRFYVFLTESIDEGNSFQKSFIAYRHHLGKIIPVPVQQLIITGEQSGNLAEMLLSISKSYEERSETTTKDLSVILEPMLLVIVWLGVVAVAMAVILPIYSLIGGLKT